MKFPKWRTTDSSDAVVYAVANFLFTPSGTFSLADQNVNLMEKQHAVLEEVPGRGSAGWTGAWRPAAGSAGSATAGSCAPTRLWAAAKWWF